MVLLTIHVRPKNGYSYPGKIKTVQVDSSRRLEDVLVTDLKLDTKKGVVLFSRHGRVELALNTSLASNNIQNYDILETCSCPLLSAALSAVLEDLNQINMKFTEDERTRDNIEPLLGLVVPVPTTNNHHSNNNNNTRLEPSWPDQDTLRWQQGARSHAAGRCSTRCPFAVEVRKIHQAVPHL